jgi:hypothetical protein
MVCDICKTRNPAGFCIACQKMLCEECSNQCGECGKMVCPECLVTTRSGRMLCRNCVEELKAKRAEAKAKGAPAPEAVEAEGEEFPIPEPLPRVQVRPWVASLLLGSVGILLSLLFYAWGGKVHVSVFILGILGFAWGLVGVFGKSEQKAQAFAGVLLNIVPFILAAALGLEAPWIEPEEEAGIQQTEAVNAQQKAAERLQKRQEMLRQLKSNSQR